jgi:hypothetical protein
VNYIVGQKAEKQQRLDWQKAGVSNVIEPPVHDVESGLDSIIALLRTHQLFIFDDLYQLLDQMGTYRRKVDPVTDETSDEIENKSAYHFIDGLRYGIVGSEQPAYEVWSF